MSVSVGRVVAVRVAVGGSSVDVGGTIVAVAVGGTALNVGVNVAVGGTVVRVTVAGGAVWVAVAGAVRVGVRVLGAGGLDVRVAVGRVGVGVAVGGFGVCVGGRGVGVRVPVGGTDVRVAVRLGVTEAVIVVVPVRVGDGGLVGVALAVAARVPVAPRLGVGVRLTLWAVGVGLADGALPVGVLETVAVMPAPGVDGRRGVGVLRWPVIGTPATVGSARKVADGDAV